MIEKANSASGRHPVWICILIALLLGQVLQLTALVLGKDLRGFSNMESWMAVAYNVAGALSSLAILYGVFRQGRHMPLGMYVTALLVERYGSGALGLTVLVYTLHQIAQPGGGIPILLPFIALGLFIRYYTIKRELRVIQRDLALAKRMVQARELHNSGV